MMYLAVDGGLDPLVQVGVELGVVLPDLINRVVCPNFGHSALSSDTLP